MEPRSRLLVLGATFALGIALLAGAHAALAKVYEKRDHALRRVFGAEATLDRRTVFLTSAQVDSVRALARAPLTEKRVTYYRATQGDSLLGHAFLDTHIVRSLYETLLVVVAPNGTVRSVEVLAFHEPEDYLPPERWLHTLRGRGLSTRLRPGDAVDAISGATLSARAATDAVRRVLALDHVLHGEQR